MYSLYYEQLSTDFDLAFNDEILDKVEIQWRSIIGVAEGDNQPEFLKFEERNAFGDDDDFNEDY